MIIIFNTFYIFKKKIYFFCLFFLIFSFFGSSVFGEQDKLKIVTTFTVIKDIVQNVAGKNADVISITKPGAEVHGYKPTPRDIAKTLEADVIISNGFNLETWFNKFYSNFNNVKTITLTSGVKPIRIGEGNYEGEPNPHAWMSLDNIFIYIDNIQKGLSDIDPKNKNSYLSNANIYKNKIRELVYPLRKKIRELPEEKRWLITCEGAFSYLADDYKLKELYLWPINSDLISRPQQIKRIIDTIKEKKIDAVFCESTVSQIPAKEIARQTDAKYGGILYVDSLTNESGPVPTYLDLIKVTSQTILEGLN